MGWELLNGLLLSLRVLLFGLGVFIRLLLRLRLLLFGLGVEVGLLLRLRLRVLFGLLLVVCFVGPISWDSGSFFHISITIIIIVISHEILFIFCIFL